MVDWITSGLKEHIEFFREVANLEKCRSQKILVSLYHVTDLKNLKILFSLLPCYRSEHVVALLGMVTKSQPVLLLMEYLEKGDLHNFLRNHRYTT